MTDRENLISDFLNNAGWKNAERVNLAGDASFRRYQRISLNNKKAILMNAPPDKENVQSFIYFTEHLRSLGYSAPEIFAKDTKTGLILLEDLGDTTFTIMIAHGSNEKTLYECAVDLLIDMHKRPKDQIVPNNISLYDNKTFIEEALLLTEWYTPQVVGRNLSAEAKMDFELVWRQLLSKCPSIKNTLVLKDFHADNLMWLPNRNGISACGIIDYQDALLGPAIYDLMSLLEDVRRNIRPDFVEFLQKRYLNAFPRINPLEFKDSFSILAAQRHCKVIGIFSRLALRDGKNSYLSYLPRAWRLLENKCLSSTLSPLKFWLDKYIQPQHREHALKNYAHD